MATAFEEMGVCAELLRVVEEQQWLVPTPVQSEVIPLLLGGGDVLAAAEMGSGKTGAFMIPLFQVIQETLLDRQPNDPGDAGDIDGKNENGGGTVDKENASASSNSAQTIERGQVDDTTNDRKQSACDAPTGVDRGLSNSASDSVVITPLLSWSQADKDTWLVLSKDCLSCSSQHGKQWVGCRAALGVRSAKGGKFYYECEVTGNTSSTGEEDTKSSSSSVVRVGWSTIAASLDLGTDRQGFGYGGAGKKSHARQYEDYGETFGPGDVIGCFLDLDTREISFSKNGTAFRRAFGIKVLGNSAALFPAIVLKNAAVTVNFGELRPFQYPPPVEYKKISVLKKSERVLNSKNQRQERSKATAPLGIILEPSRDLAHQVFECALAFKKYMTSPYVRVALTVGGGASVKEQVQKMHKQSGCGLVVGTPGRISELIDSGYLDLSNVKFFVLDEIDQLISTDNVPVVRQIYKNLGGRTTTAMDYGVNRLQVSFFSATLHAKSVSELSDQICRHPLIVDLKGRDFVPETVHHLMLEIDPAILIKGDGNNGSDAPSEMVCTGPTATLPPVDQVHDSSVQKRASALLQNPQPSLTQITQSGSDKSEVFSQLLKYWKPRILVELLEKLAIEQCMVFCRTNLDCDLLEQYLLAVGGGKGQRQQQRFTGEKLERGKENPFSCCVLAGMRSLSSRQQALEAFKDGDVRILICTDVATRGIDVKQLACVINMTLPDTEENYIHRVGRVGRSDHMGLAISIVAAEEVRERVWFHRCSKFKCKGCVNRKSVENGGCTIWYSESVLKRGIEVRLQEIVACFTTVGELVGDIEARGGMKQYGAECSSSSENQEAKNKKATKLQQQQLAPMVKNLIALEERVQSSWLQINELLR